MSQERILTVGDFVRVAVGGDAPELMDKGLLSLQKRLTPSEQSQLPELSFTQSVLILRILTDYDDTQLSNLFQDLAASFGNFSITTQQFEERIAED